MRVSDECHQLVLRGVAHPIPACRLTITPGEDNRDIPASRLSGAAR